MKSGGHHRHRGEHGQEIIEFAVILPLLVLLLAGSIEFGHAFYTYNILTKSVRNAARYLSNTQISSTGAIAAGYVTNTQNLAVYGKVSPVSGDLKIIPDLQTSHIIVPGTATQGPSATQYYVTVSASYPYTPLFWYPLSGITFRPKVTMLFLGVVTYPSK